MAFILLKMMTKCIRKSMDTACSNYFPNKVIQEVGNPKEILQPLKLRVFRVCKGGHEVKLSQQIKISRDTRGGKPRGNSSAAETSRVQGMQGGSPSEKVFI